MTDGRIPLIVVVTLAVVVVLGEAAMAYLAFTGTAIPDQLDRIATLAIGALAAILATTRGTDPAPVQVMNEPDEPVPVDDAKAKK